jgi:drug/metabolite transporter (DMT)-like permease
MMNQRRRAHLALIFAGLLFGANYWIAKSTMPAFTPFQVVGFRIGIVTFVFWMLGVFFPEKKPIAPRDMVKIIFAGILGVTVNQVFFFRGLQFSSPIEASILHTLSPLLVALFAISILKEKVSLRKFVGIAAGLTGALIIVTSGKPIDFSNIHFKGNLFILLNISVYSLYLIIIKPVMEKYEPIQVLRYVFLAGFVTYLPIGVYHFKQFSWSLPNTENWLALLYVVVGTTLLTYLLIVFAIKRLPATTIGFYIYLQPFIASSIGYVFGFEHLTLAVIVAAAFLFAGVWLVIGDKQQ